MSDEHNTNNEVSLEDLQKQMAEKDAMLQDMQKQFEAIKSNRDELLDEKKKVQAEARMKQEEAEKARLAKAEKEGDFKQLLESSEAQRKELEDRLNKMQQSISTEKTRSEAMKLAAELADGANAEILSEFVSRRIKYTDDGLKVLDGDGNLTVSSLDDLKNEFANNAKFKALIRGSKSSGGGAAGDGGGASGAKEVKRSHFDNMEPNDRFAFIKDGGRVVD